MSSKINIENKKNINPTTLELGQIANDRKVGDKKMDKDKIRRIVLSISLNFKLKHLKKI